MADQTNDKTISSTVSGFPDYLSFEKLRSDAIAYLGNLTGKVWTDYNVHDPGITILETLIYAVLDLGYRTNLPAIDLFTKDPADTTKENNFFTPAQILANNPLTIMDFRKMLIDINGVKNAWLTIEDQMPADPCRKENNFPGIAGNQPHNPCKCDYLNGLYHVFIELEKDYDSAVASEKETIEFVDIIYKIKCALMKHRNLCEDFIDIKILCKLKTGLCADIELEPDADGDEVYLKILESIRSFFSPSPQFYTLPQLLQKGKSIDEIFAGRPYNIKESYGFVDTDEFEQITLRKTIHLSDLFHVLFDIEGVKNVRNLAFKFCNNDDKKLVENTWTLHLPENFIPEFDINCSGFQFYKYGLKIKPDTSEVHSIFSLNFSANGKILYSQPSPYQDSKIPQSVFRSDLAEYYSIQNEFPHVYGIKKGDLSATAPDRRKAQALQLQGFLLFFDQLLANYLSQLKNIRSLFSLSPADKMDQAHTYFTNKLTDVPELQKLLRFNTGNNAEENLASEGSVLAYPTSRKNLEALISSGKIKNTDLDRRCNDVNKDDFPPYQFCYGTVRDQAEYQLIDDLLNGDYEPVIIANYNDCYFFYCFTSSADIALISKKYYGSFQEAQTAAASVKYLGTFKENYYSFIIDDDISSQFFTFNLQLNINDYSKYLQLITENETLYISRRQGFLNHLLARFAEQFTDYALLSSGISTSEQLQKSQIKAEEKFLINYPELSSNRGKAYNYKCNGWNNENISGFEKRVKALSGIQNWKKHYLCNFVVEKADEIYHLSISVFGSSFVESKKYFTYEAGYSSLNSIYSKLRNNPVFEFEYIGHEQRWSAFIKDEYGNKFINQNLFDSEAAAETYTRSLFSIISDKPDSNTNVFVSKFIYRLLFQSHDDETIEESKTKFDTIEEAQKYFNKISGKISNYLTDSNEFQKVKKGFRLDKLMVVDEENNSVAYIDKNKFNFISAKVVQLNSVKIKFTLLNDKKTIQFDSLLLFETLKNAQSASDKLIRLSFFRNNYDIAKSNAGAGYEIRIKDGDNDVATFFPLFTTEEEAQNKIPEIINEIISYSYHLIISDPLADNWEFKYQLKNPAGSNIEFKTRAAYTSEPQAQAAAKQFYMHIPLLKITKLKNDVQLILDNNKKIVAYAALPEDTDTGAVRTLLQYHQQLFSEINNPSKKLIDNILETGKDPAREQFIYKLVDKDNLLAKANYASTEPSAAREYRNNLITNFQSGYDYTKLSFGNDIIDERKDATGKKTWYHYAIKCNNRRYQKGTLKGQAFILFESVLGYQTKKDAINAFNENYLVILRKAFDETNYGDGKFISPNEILIHEVDECNKTISTVFIRPETLYEFDGDAAETIKQIIVLAKSYPVVFISAGNYNFSLYNKQTKTYDWRSIQRYSMPAEAMQAFHFFLTLLPYSGNIIIEKNETDCRYRIYIREVLAISTNTFQNEEEAWGSTGIEKFICVAQSVKGFHTYLNRKTCSDSFYVACGNTGLIHPCKYETPERRDIVMNSLYKFASFNFFDLLKNDKEDGYMLLGLDKKPVAKLYIQTNANRQIDACERLIEIFEAIEDDKNYENPKSEEIYLNDKNKIKIAEPVTPNITQSDWKKQLRNVSCFFPLYKKQNVDSTSKNRRTTCDFYIRINLPGFNNCKDDGADNCPDIPTDDCKPGCHVAWKSDCCFSTCREAFLFYLKSLKTLSVFGNYKPVYECDCGYYGIGIHQSEFIEDEQKDDLKNYRILNHDEKTEYLKINIRDRILNKCNNEIVAINPQQYNNSLMACEAVNRAKKLINCEGLHLVEHILLRPRCKNADGIYEDCNCESLPAPCLNQDNFCQFEWNPGGDTDPCEADKIICFTLGCDPYSFIATIALPAWPQRFRSVENKAVIEKLLQKEAPAHVLLRILWLNPRDFCCFEFHYKKWNYWLAKRMCDAEYNNCDFLGFLFHKYLEPLTACNECEPCSCNEIETVGCFDKEEEKDPCESFNLKDQLNELYCWNKNDYDRYNCDDNIFQNPNTVLTAKAKINVPDKKPETLRNPLEKRTQKPLIIDENIEQKPDDHQKHLLMQSRFTKYHKNIQNIIASTPGNKVAEDCLRFLSDTNPDPERYEDLINKILKNKTNKAKGIAGLTLKEKNILIDNITWQYFDRICTTEKGLDKIKKLAPVFNHLGKNKINVQQVFDDWNGKDLHAIDPKINLDQISKAVT